MQAIRLKTEHLINPIGVDFTAPRLSWNCDGGVKQTGVLIGGEAIAELTDGAGVDKGPLEPAGRKLGKLRVHGDPSFPES